jgi:glycosyltransferase involved in cell wall biosynthesis
MLHMAAEPQPAPDPGAPAADVVFSFYTESWAGAAKHGFYMPDSRLSLFLLGSERVRRLIVASNQRSLPLLHARRALGERTDDFPSDERRHLVEPTRWRRDDPTRIGPLRRTVRAYDASLRRAVERHGLERPVVITSNPFVAGLADLSWARAVTYYGVDDWAVHPGWERWWPVLETAYAGMRERGRRVCAVTTTGLDRVAPTGPGLALPNGLKPEEWLGEAPSRRAPGEPPLLVYVGTLDERLDVSIVSRVAAELPHAKVLLVGPVASEDHVRPLRDASNVEIRPRVGRAEVAALIRSADAGLVPHARTPLTAAMSPLKLYEYLAGGLAVAAIDLPPMRDVDERVVLAAKPGDFVAATRKALAMGRAPEPEREAFVHANSWDSRLNRLLDLAVAAG